MYIKEIEIFNFRIYKNQHRLFFSPEKNKNVFIVAGNNGYGKTTFLTGLVWCLYGKYMKDVDDTYKNQINEVGGYTKFIQSCMNNSATKQSEREFSFSITFADIDIPALPCNEIKIKRIGYSKKGLEEVKIYIDGHENELTKEVGNDLFIQDFLLPKEIAKFFFFDSEKIVSLAESKSISSKRQLSKAYSEVLGIQKYVDLKKNLEDVTIRFRKDSAKPAEKKKIEELKTQLDTLEKREYDLSYHIERLEEEKLLLKKQSEELQERLIREGSSLSLDDITNLKIEKHQLNKKLELLKVEFKDLLELAPFAISGKLVNAVKIQLDSEYSSELSGKHQELLNKKSKQILLAFNKLKPKPDIKLDKITRKFYQEELTKLLEKYLHHRQSSKIEEQSNTELQLDFSEEEYNQFNSIFLQLKTSYADRVKLVSKSLKDTRLRVSKISRKLSNAENKESDGVITKYRNEKKEKDKEISIIEDKLNEMHQQIGATKNDFAAKRKIYEEAAKKVRMQERFVEKDNLARRLVIELEEFIAKIKIEKKSALEKKILQGLKTLMHKKDFVKEVQVEIDGDLIDIHLIDSKGSKINKDTLSKGEQQLYATSILSALVEESNIEFPVFIDSPLQKFDARHAKNIIANFYPAISKQVVLLPLLEKEMTKEEFTLLEEKVKGAFIIQNEYEDSSYFISVKPHRLFDFAKKLQKNVL